MRATYLQIPVLRSAVLMDYEQLHTDIKKALLEDTITLEHIDQSDNACWSTDEHGFLRFDNRIYVPDTGTLRLRVMQFNHDHITSGHYGYNKTLSLIRRDYTWPGIRDMVKEYCRTCVDCARAKPRRHKPYGKLKQLPIPERPWNSISMDFIEKLPASDGYTAILVIMDCLTKQSIFIPTHDTVTSQDLAKLFIMHVFSKHGVPSHVTSDRGSEFVSHFFRSLGKVLDMTLHFTSGYHPEGDGQTEYTNQTLE